MIFFMPLTLMFTPLPMIQTYINLFPSSASLPLMLVLNLFLLCLQLLTQICSDRILTFGIRSIRSPAKVGLVVTELLITSPVVSRRGVGDPPPPPPQPRLNCHSLLNHGWVKTSLSVVACLRRLLLTLFTFLVDGLDFSSTCQSEYFLNFLFRLCQESYVYVLEWGTENVVPFCQHWTETPTPLALGVGVRYVPKT